MLKIPGIVNTHGVCSGCKKTVQLIYLNPETKKDLVIGPHHPPLDCQKFEDYRNQNCSGWRRPPMYEDLTQLETTAQK